MSQFFDNRAMLGLAHTGKLTDPGWAMLKKRIAHSIALSALPLQSATTGKPLAVVSACVRYQMIAANNLPWRAVKVADDDTVTVLNSTNFQHRIRLSTSTP